MLQKGVHKIFNNNYRTNLSNIWILDFDRKLVRKMNHTSVVIKQKYIILLDLK